MKYFIILFAFILAFVNADFIKSTKTIPSSTSTKAVPTQVCDENEGYDYETDIHCVEYHGVYVRVYDESDGCYHYSCVRKTKTIPSSTSTTSKTIPISSSTKTVSTTTSTKAVPTQVCDENEGYDYETDIHCVEFHGVYVRVYDESDGCYHYSCVRKTKTIPSSTSTTSKTIPISSSTKTVSTTTSTKAVPTQVCDENEGYDYETDIHCVEFHGVYVRVYDESDGCYHYSCIRKTKTIPSSTSTTSKTIPTTSSTSTIVTITTTTTSTKVIPTTSTKTPPISTTTTTKTIPITNCTPKTITITEKETITERETITVTIQSQSTGVISDPSMNCADKWGQCGGAGFNGPSCCKPGLTCQEVNQWYSQCL